MYKYYLIAISAVFLSANLFAADISFGGYLLDRNDWRDGSASKFDPHSKHQGDADGDEVLGTAGYILFGPSGQEGGKTEVGEDWLSTVTAKLPSWIEDVEIMQPAQLGRFPGYAVVDHPEKDDLSFTTGALIIESSEDKVPVLRITVGEGVPNAVRIGVMVDNIDQGIFNTRALYVKTGDFEMGPFVTLAQVGSTNSVADYYFFDFTRASPGDTFILSAQPGAANVITIGALTFDAAPLKNYSEFEHEGYYLKDFFVYKDDDTYHLFYNIGLADGKQEWQLPGNEEMFGHATSKDLKNWTYHDGVMATRPLTWEEATVSAPTIIKRDDGTYLMAYTGFDRNANQRMGLAMSDDLFNWERYEGNPLAIEPEWTSWKPEGWADFRDPHLLEMDDGYTYVFNTAHVPHVGGAVAVARSKDLINWEDLGKDRAIYPGFHPAESVHAFERNGKIYAFIGGGGHALMVTDDIMSGEWEKVPFIFPRVGFWSGFEVVEGPEGQMLICAFQWKMHGNFIRFWEVDWDGDVPVIKQ